MKKKLVLIATIILTAYVVACTSQVVAPTETTATSTEQVAPTSTNQYLLQGAKGEVYYMNVPGVGIEYWYPCFQGFKDAARALGVSAYYNGSPTYDATTQAETFEQTIALNPTGILVHPAVAEVFVDPIKRATDKGIQIATFAADSPDSVRRAYVTSDNTKEGNRAAEEIAKKLGGKGEVMVMRNPGQSNHEIRCDSFIAYLKANYPDIKVVAEEVSGQNEDKTNAAVKTVAQAHPDLAAVFTPEATSAAGAAQAGIELGNGQQKLLVACCDTSDTVLDLLKEDKFFFAIAPDQYLQGYLGMLNLYFAKHNEVLRPMNGRKAAGENFWQIPYMDNGLSIVTKENADFFYLDNYAKNVIGCTRDELIAPYIAE